MAKIHHNVVVVEHQPIPDQPGRTRAVETRERSSVHKIGDEYSADEDGNFEVPDELADLLCGFASSGWTRGARPADSNAPKKAPAKPVAKQS